MVDAVAVACKIQHNSQPMQAVCGWSTLSPAPDLRSPTSYQSAFPSSSRQSFLLPSPCSPGLLPPPQHPTCTIPAGHGQD
eukprot:208170-Chlamydomonas_euryale.AAC.1